MPTGVYERRPGVRKLVDLSGRRYGRLLVVCLDHRDGHNRAGSVTWWRCRCDCGAEHVVTTALLRNGSVRSCGCLRREMARARGLSQARLPIGPIIDLREQGFSFAAIARLLQGTMKAVQSRYYRFMSRLKRLAS